MTSTLILVVDGDRSVRRYLRSQLEMEGYRVSLGEKREDTLQLLEAERPDLVVLELNLAGQDNLSVLRQIRKRSQVPVIMLTAEENRREMIAALDLGADDCVAKPLDVDELIARLRAVLRRTSTAVEPAAGLIDLGGLLIDVDRHCLVVEDREVPLSRTEWQLLSQLTANLDRVMSHRELLAKVWGPESNADEQRLRDWICRLRHKMGDRSDNPHYLVTMPGVGYRLRRRRGSEALVRQN